jgi:hypothetical protein
VVSYGLVDADYEMRLREITDQADGPVYMLTMTGFRPGCGQLFGRESMLDPDSRYAPLSLFSAVGASLCFMADVVAGQGGWHRVGVVRYPTRRAFIKLGDRRETKEWNSMKEERAVRMIMLGLNPVGSLPVAQHQRVVLEVWQGSAPEPIAPGTATGFEVEGTYIGDGRQWSGARYTAIEPGTALPVEPARFGYVALLVEPILERWI